MDTFAFWLPLLLLFISGLFGAVIKRRSCDHCLKKFEANKILLPLTTGEWVCGKLEVFAQGIELQTIDENSIKISPFSSRVLHSAEVDEIPFLIKQAPHPDTRAGLQWKKDREKLLRPTLKYKVRRSIINSYNMLRDCFGQALRAIIGAMSKDTRLGKAKDSDKRLQEMQTNLII